MERKTYRVTQGAELVENTAKGPHITAGGHGRAGGYSFPLDLRLKKKEQPKAVASLLLLYGLFSQISGAT